MKRRAIFAAIAVFVTSIVSIPTAFAAPQYSFTSAGASGQNGPTQAQIDSAYSGTSLAGLVTINTQGIQEWSVPATGEYWLEFAGASGGFTPNANGGKGRIIKVKVNLTAGHLLKILVGQEGGRSAFTTGYAGGGGGGTYIYNATTSSYIGVAGGGGGAAQGDTNYVSSQAGVDATTYNTTSGAQGSSYSGSYSIGGAGGTNGAAGAVSGGASGAGINGNGGTGSYGGAGGVRFLSGGSGGANGVYNPSLTTMTLNVGGGFGGGGGASLYSSYEANGGGGGGYSGGGGGGTRVGAGGGGGNYFTGTYVSSALNTGNGYVTIKSTAAPTVSLSIAGSVKEITKGQSILLTATVDDTVKITFYANGKRIPNCIGMSANSGNVTCNWKPTQQSAISVYSIISQGGVEVARSSSLVVLSKRRTGTRS